MFTPYLSTLGGGEKYLFDIASCFPESSVDIFWNDRKILLDARERFGELPENLIVKPSIFPNAGVFQKFQKTSLYDVFFYCSDGSIPFLFGRKNILIFQFPMPWIQRNTFTKIKMMNIHAVICYSNFVKQYIDKTFGISSSVLYPAVEKMPEVAKKENIILSVGRFTKGKNTKKQELLIDAFKKNFSTSFRGWKFYLLGGVLDEDKEFVKHLETFSKGYPILIKTNVSYQEIKESYEKSKIYWHAAGFGEDLKTHPESAEHFGITTVEAMSAGCVPVSFKAGGQTEIIEDGVSGFLWNDPDELLVKTKQVIQSPKLLQAISEGAKKRSSFFSKDRFCKKLHSVLK